MNKQIITIFLVLSLISATLAVKPVVNNGEEIDICAGCVNAVSKGINDLIDEIIQGGVIGSCGALCSFLPNALFQMVCNLGCDAVGIDEFIKIVGDADIDPIFYCEELHLCKKSLTANATIQDVAIYPVHGFVCDTFSIGLSYNITNAIGTGEVAYSVIDPTGNGFGSADLLVGTAPGIYQAQFSFQAAPSQGESFPSGEYMLQVAICEGSCGSGHKYTRLLSLMSTNFTLINDQSGGSNSNPSSSSTGSNSNQNSGSFSGTSSGNAFGSASSQSEGTSGSSGVQCSSGSGSGSGLVRFF